MTWHHCHALQPHARTAFPLPLHSFSGLRRRSDTQLLKINPCGGSLHFTDTPGKDVFENEVGRCCCCCWCVIVQGVVVCAQPCAGRPLCTAFPLARTTASFNNIPKLRAAPPHCCCAAGRRVQLPAARRPVRGGGAGLRAAGLCGGWQLRPGAAGHACAHSSDAARRAPGEAGDREQVAGGAAAGERAAARFWVLAQERQERGRRRRMLPPLLVHNSESSLPHAYDP